MKGLAAYYENPRPLFPRSALMTKYVLASLTLLLAGTGLVSAQNCCDIPTTKIPPIQLLSKEIEPFNEAAPINIPGVKFFHADVASPKYLDCPPQPPIKFFRCPPPVVKAYVVPPPKVDLFRAEPLPPRPPIVCKQPPITVYRVCPECPREVPPVRLPSVTVLNKPQPPAPVEVPCPCK